MRSPTCCVSGSTRPGSSRPAGCVPGRSCTRLGHVPVGAAGPMLADAAANHVAVDSVVHRTFWVESWPERRQAGGLVRTGARRRPRRVVVQRVFTLVVEPLSDAKAVSEIAPRRRPPRRRAPSRRRGPHPLGRVQGRRAAAVDEREHELADGHVPVAYAGFVTITVSEPRRAATGRARAIQRRCATPPGAARDRCGGGWNSASPPPCRSDSACPGSRSDGRRHRRRSRQPSGGSPRSSPAARCPATARRPPTSARSTRRRPGPAATRSARCSASTSSAGDGAAVLGPVRGLQRKDWSTNPNVFVMGEPGFAKSQPDQVLGVLADTASTGRAAGSPSPTPKANTARSPS